jgi:hypothetical protein
MQFLRDHVHKSSMSVDKDSADGRQLLDILNNLKLEFTRLEFSHRSPHTVII